jgi:hypothetical protein
MTRESREIERGGRDWAILSGRPMHGTASNEMHEQVEDGLAGERADVQDGTVSIFDRSIASNAGRGQVAKADELGIFGGSFLQAGDVFLRDHEDMGWTLRIEIFKSEDVLVFINFLGRYFAANNAAKKTVRHLLLTFAERRSATAWNPGLLARRTQNNNTVT